MANPLSIDPLQTDTSAALTAAPPPRQSSTAIPDQANYQSAMAKMNLNPQEQALYQMHLSNLYGAGGVDNPDGSRSSLYQMTVGFGDKTYVLPRVWNGQIVSEDQAIELARQYGLDRFPSYETPEAAESRYQQMHDYMEKDTAAYLAGRK